MMDRVVPVLNELLETALMLVDGPSHTEILSNYAISVQCHLLRERTEVCFEARRDGLIEERPPNLTPQE